MKARVPSVPVGDRGIARRTRHGRFLGGILLLVLGGGMQGSPAADIAAKDQGLSLLRSGRTAEARLLFREALAAGREDTDTAQQAEALFYLGLTDQREAMAQQGKDLALAASLFSKALDSYTQASELRPESPGILNNLAQVQAQLGRTNDALATLARAIAIPDPRQAYYTQNYADLLANAGRWFDACRFYAVVAGEQPQNRAVHQRLVGLCLEKGPDALGWYLWELARGGQVIQVQNHVLAVLDNPVWSPAQRDELMTLLAYCLSRQGLDRQEFLASPTAARLREFVDHPQVGGGARELVRMIEGRELQSETFPWWSSRTGSTPDASRGMAPVEAAQALARSLADQARAAGDTRQAESYLLLAVEANRQNPDPEALTRLANFYGERRQLDRLSDLMRRHEVDIFQAKGAAYSAAQIEKIYRYHMALGVIYSQLGRWTSDRRIDSAIFQLDRALRTADELKQSTDPGAAPPVVVPARLVEMLSEAYEKTGRPEEAFRVRVQRAEKFLENNQPDEAKRLIEPLRNVRPPARVTDADKATLQRVDRALVNPALVPNRAATGPARVQVAPAAANVVGGRGRRTLTDAERKGLEDSLNGIVANLDAGAGASNRPHASTAVGRNLPEGVQEVTVNGNAGRALVRKGTNLFEVPFTVANPAPATRDKVRVVRP